MKGEEVKVEPAKEAPMEASTAGARSVVVEQPVSFPPLPFSTPISFLAVVSVLFLLFAGPFSLHFPN